MKQRDISVLSGDRVNDVQPSGVVCAGPAANRPIHTLAIAVLEYRWWTPLIWRTWHAKRPPASGGNF